MVPIPGTEAPKYLAENAAEADAGLTPVGLADLDTLPWRRKAPGTDKG